MVSEKPERGSAKGEMSLIADREIRGRTTQGSAFNKQFVTSSDEADTTKHWLTIQARRSTGFGSIKSTKDGLLKLASPSLSSFSAYYS